MEQSPWCTYSSVSGVIFLAGSSSSANSFLYFSQLCPVALGIFEAEGLCLLVDYVSQSKDPAAVDAREDEAMQVPNQVSLL